MLKRICLGLFFAFTLSSASFAEGPDWNQIIELIRNLTAAINSADATANKYLVFIKDNLPEIEVAIRDNWPVVQGFLALFGQLPNALTDASQYIMVGFIAIGICVVISTVVCVGASAYGFCRKRPTSFYHYNSVND